jgi:hypothetical protein
VGISLQTPERPHRTKLDKFTWLEGDSMGTT